eukprot:6782608-Pyramimonas_sp.AAC.1
MPDEWKLMCLEEGVGLDEESAQLAKISMKGERTYQAALAALREMDISHRERLQRPEGRQAYVAYDSSGAASSQTLRDVSPPPVPPVPSQ